MKKLILFSFLWVCLITESCLLFAQENTKVIEDNVGRLIEQGEYNLALPLCKQLYDKSPRDFKFNYWLGRCLVELNVDIPHAKKYLLYAALYAKTDYHVYYFLGKACCNIYEIDQAKRNFLLFKNHPSSTNKEKEETDFLLAQTDRLMHFVGNAEGVYVYSNKEIARKGFYRSANYILTSGVIQPLTEELKSAQDKRYVDANQVMFICKNRNVIYFSSLDKNNQKDIYEIHKNTNEQWTKPEKVAGAINSEYDEDFPVLSEDGMQMYFASKGHDAMGGYDIFVSKYDTVNKLWQKPVNMGFPINSPANDFLMVYNKASQLYTFVSDRMQNQDKFNLIEVRKGKRTMLKKGLINQQGAMLPEMILEVVKVAKLKAEELDASVYATNQMSEKNINKTDNKPYPLINCELSGQNASNNDTLTYLSCLLDKNRVELNELDYKIKATNILLKEKKQSRDHNKLMNDKLLFELEIAVEKKDEIQYKIEDLKERSEILNDQIILIQKMDSLLKGSVKSKQEANKELIKLMDAYKQAVEGARALDMKPVDEDIVTVINNNKIRYQDGEVIRQCCPDIKLYEVLNNKIAENKKFILRLKQDLDDNIADQNKLEQDIQNTKKKSSRAVLNEQLETLKQENNSIQTQYDKKIALNEKIQNQSDSLKEKIEGYKGIFDRVLLISDSLYLIENKHVVKSTLNQGDNLKEFIAIELLRNYAFGKDLKQKKETVNQELTKKATLLLQQKNRIKQRFASAMEITINNLTHTKQLLNGEDSLYISIDEQKQLNALLQKTLVTYTIANHYKKQYYKIDELFEITHLFKDELINYTEISDTVLLGRRYLEWSLIIEANSHLFEEKEDLKLLIGDIVKENEKNVNQSYEQNLNFENVIAELKEKRQTLENQLLIKDYGGKEREELEVQLKLVEKEMVDVQLAMIDNQKNVIQTKLLLQYIKLINITDLHDILVSESQKEQFKYDINQYTLNNHEQQEAIFGMIYQLQQANIIAQRIDKPKKDALEKKKQKVEFINTEQNNVQKEPKRVEDEVIKTPTKTAVDMAKQRDEYKKEVKRIDNKLDKLEESIRIDKEKLNKIRVAEDDSLVKINNVDISTLIIAQQLETTSASYYAIIKEGKKIIDIEKDDSLKYQMMKELDSLLMISYEEQKKAIKIYESVRNNKDVIIAGITLSDVHENIDIQKGDVESKYEAQYSHLYSKNAQEYADNKIRLASVNKSNIGSEMVKLSEFMLEDADRFMEMSKEKRMEADTAKDITMREGLINIANEYESYALTKQKQALVLVEQLNNTTESAVVKVESDKKDVMQLIDAEEQKAVAKMDLTVYEDLVFKVQIGAYKRSVPYAIFNGIAPISFEKDEDGYIRILAGVFNSENEVLKAQKILVQKGFTDAFVVAYIQGKRTSYSEAVKMKNSGAVSVVKQVKGINYHSDIVYSKSIAEVDDVKKVNGLDANQNIVQIKSLVYSVQIGVYSKDIVSELKENYNIKDVYYENLTDGKIRYLLGRYSNIQEAKAAQKNMRKKGMKDAFVVAYFDGKQITLSYAKQLEK